MSRAVKAIIPPRGPEATGLLGYPVSEKQGHLGVDDTPVLTAPSPLFRDVHHGQIQHLEQAVICGLCAFL